MPSWGWSDAHQGLVKPFPGIAAPWQAFDAYGLYGYGGDRAMIRWFAARGLRPETTFRRRFLLEPSRQGRFVWAGYLVSLGDTAALPWLRNVAARSRGGERETALGIASPFARRVTEVALLGQLQDVLLRYALDCDAPPDTTGRPIEPFAPHDERPGEWWLLAEGLTNGVLARWAGRIRRIGRDSLRQLASREGLQMALIVRAVRELAGRFYAGIDLVPIGESCLCGGGVYLQLERQGERWVVFVSGSWIS